MYNGIIKTHLGLLNCINFYMTQVRQIALHSMADHSKSYFHDKLKF